MSYKTTLLNTVAIRCLTQAAAKLPPGATVICAGVYRGGDVAAMGAIRPDLFFICIDSFEGLAEPTDLDGATPAGEFIATVKEFMQTTRGLNVFINKLWITPESLEGLYCNDISSPDMLWLDLDHHSPTRAMLAHFLPKMDENAIVLTHDYGSTTHPGVKVACDEFGEWEILGNSIAKLK